MGSGSAGIRPRTPSRPLRCPPGAASWHAGRTRRCGRRRTRSGCRPGQMGNSEVGHLNLGAGRPVLQDLPADRCGHRRRLLLRAAGVPRRLCSCARARPASSTSSASSGRAASTPTTGTSSRWPTWPTGTACRDVHVHALLDGRDTPPRSAIPFMAGPGGAAGGRPSRRGHRDGRRSLLRDGPRPPLGARRARLRRDRPWGGGVAPRRRRPRSRPPTPAARTTSSSLPTVIGEAGRVGIRDGEPVIHANFRADRARQLTHALADAAFDGFDRAAPGRTARARRSVRRHDDGLRGRTCRSRSPSRPRRPDRWPRPSRRPAGGSSMSRRPRSTPTSPTSSTAASRRRIRARSDG